MIKDVGLYLFKLFLYFFAAFIIILFTATLIVNIYRHMTEKIHTQIVQQDCHLIFYPDTQTFINPCSNEIIRSE
jgi:hypothetical protein